MPAISIAYARHAAAIAVIATDRLDPLSKQEYRSGMTASQPYRRSMTKQSCGARTKFGTYCLQWPVPGKHRCYRHGGRHRTWEGKRNIGPAHEALRRLQAYRKSIGLKWYGGRSFKRSKVERMADEARQVLVTLIEAAETPGGEWKDVGSLAPPELLSATLALGLRRLYEVVGLPLTDWRRERLVAETSLGVAKIALRINEQEFQRQKTDKLGELLERIKGLRPAAE